jgi:predicted PurR-regulated permease PerM
MLQVGIFLILLTAALRLGAGLLLPIAIAALFTLLLDPPVRALHRAGISTGLSAVMVVFGALAVVGSGIALSAGPAADWIARAPKTVVQVRAKVTKLLIPFAETVKQVDQAAESAAPGGPPTVQLKAPALSERLSGNTTRFLATTVTIVFLTYFLLTMLPVFRGRLAELIGTRTGARDVEAVLKEIELQMSRYMMLNTLTSAGVGLATWALLAAVGLSNALLWGVVSFFLNFVPYLGALATVLLVGAAALVQFDDTGRVLVVVGGCMLINLLEGNLITPHLLGRHLALNPVAIFVSLLYWGWVWGPAGTLLAVPITVMLQVIFARVERLRPIAVLLDS